MASDKACCMVCSNLSIAGLKTDAPSHLGSGIIPISISLPIHQHFLSYLTTSGFYEEKG